MRYQTNNTKIEKERNLPKRIGLRNIPKHISIEDLLCTSNISEVGRKVTESNPLFFSDFSSQQALEERKSSELINIPILERPSISTIIQEDGSTSKF